MKDIKIAEQCTHCNSNLMLMGSVRVADGSLWAVKRCLKCGNYPVQEVFQLERSEVTDANKMDRAISLYTDTLSITTKFNDEELKEFAGLIEVIGLLDKLS